MMNSSIMPILIAAVVAFQLCIGNDAASTSESAFNFSKTPTEYDDTHGSFSNRNSNTNHVMDKGNTYTSTDKSVTKSASVTMTTTKVLSPQLHNTNTISGDESSSIDDENTRTGSSMNVFDDNLPDKCTNDIASQDLFYSNLAAAFLQSNVALKMNDDNDKYNSLLCWLYNLKLNIPDEHFKSGIFSVSIKDMVCTAFEVESISSTYNPSTGKDSTITETATDPSLSISANGVSATCQGHYKSGLTGGTVTVTVNTIENTNSIETETTFQSFVLPNQNGDSGNDDIIAPHTADVSLCQTNLQVPKKGGIKFSGSISAKLIGMFSSSIAQHVTGVLKDEICPTLKTEADDIWDKMLNTMDDHLSNLINGNSFLKLNSGNDDQPGKKESSMIVTDANYISYADDKDDTSEIVTWDSDFFLMKEMMIKFNQFLSSHMNRGLVLSFLDWIGWTNPNGDDDDTGCNSSTDCGLFFRGVNGLIRFVTNSGTINIEPDSRHKYVFLIKKLGEVTLNVDNVEINGLDTLTNISIIPKNDHMVSIGLTSLEGFHFEGSMELTVKPVEGGMIKGDPLHESFDLSSNISSVSMEAALDVGMLRGKLEDISLGDLIEAISSGGKNSTMNLLLSTLAYAKFTDVRPQVHVDSFEFIPLSIGRGSLGKTLEESLDNMINHIIQLFLSEYDSLWTEALVAIGQGPIKIKLNKALEEFITKRFLENDVGTSVQVMEVSTEGNNHYFHFNSSSLIRKIHDMIDSERWIGELNKFIACVSSFIRDETDASKKLQNNNSTFNIEIKEVSVSNIDKINHIDILKAVDESHVISGFRSHWDNQTVNYLSHEQNDSSLFMKLATIIRWPLLNLRAIFSCSVSIKGILTQIGTKIDYDLETANQKSLYETIRNPVTFFQPITRESGFYNFISSMRQINFGFNITTFTSNDDPRHFNYTSSDDKRLGSIVSTTLASFGIITQDIINTAAHLAWNMTDVLNEKRQEKSIQTPQHHHLFWFLLTGIVFLSFHIIYFCFSRSANQKHFDTKKRKQRTNEAGVVPMSLALHQKIPFWLRITVPLVILGTIVVFIVSNLSTGASVDVEVHKSSNATEESTISLPSVFTFSLGKTVSEMYQAKVYTLMTLVLVFSGIWPYIKLLLMFIAWISNERWLNFERREKILIWLDAFGKYSLVDSFVLVLMLVSFRFHVDLDLPMPSIIDSFVIPKDGFYTFLCATILSLVIGHMVTYLHRYSLMPKLVCEHQGEKESLQNHIFEVKYPHQRLIQVSKKGNWLWLSFNVLCVILLIVGVMQKCFIFEFKGVAGLVLGDQREERYSLISLGTSLPLSVRNPTDIGIISIQLTYFFFALLMPFAAIIMVNILFYIPMTLKNQNRVFTFAEICNAWSAIEVFLLSVFASMLELSQFATFMVGDHCDFLKGDFLKDLFDEEDTCFSVQSKLGSGTIYLVLGVLMQCLIIFISLRLSHQTLEERMEREGLLRRRRNHKSETDSLIFKIVSLCLFQSSMSD